MRVLVACEESQRVCISFREVGHEAFSCDIQECSGGYDEWHIKGDCLSILDGDCDFSTADGKTHTIKGEWDLIIAHPPCTYLTVSGNRWFNADVYGEKALQRQKKRDEAIAFFMRFAHAKCKHIAIENPIGIMSNVYRKPDQIIQPYWFGEHARKSTCLWLKGLPLLTPTDITDMGEIDSNGSSVGASANWARDEDGKIIPWNDPRTAIIRSKTFWGIARAMAEQWSRFDYEQISIIEYLKGCQLNV